MKKTLLFLTIISMSFTSWSQAPANDDCANRITITVATGGANSYSVDLTNATESLDASCENSANDNYDAWYEFTMPVNGNVHITGIPNSVTRSLFDSCGGTELACGGDDGFFSNLTASTTYVLRIAEQFNFAGTVNFNIEAFEAAANDECVNRTTITVPTGGAASYSLDLRAATESLDASCEVSGNNNLDVWYEFTMPVDGNVHITGIPSNVTRTLYDSCGGVELVCGLNNGFFFNLTSGVTYVLRLSERDIFAGTVNFNIEAFATPTNDECVGRSTIVVPTGGPATYSFDTRAATESMDASCETSGNNNLDIWYEFTMPVNGNVHITGIPNTINRTLFESCGGAELVCGYDDGFFYNLTSGTTYVLRMAERSLFAGSVNFNIEAFATPANDECAGRTSIVVPTGGPATYNFDSRAVTESLDGSCENAANTNLDAWYEFTMPVNGNVRITGIPNTVYRVLYDSCGGTELICGVDDGFFFGLSAGVTYVLRMSERSLFAGVVNFNIEAFEVAPNDECVNRTTITVPTASAASYSFDARTATESTDGSCETPSNTHQDVWYEFTMPVNGNVRITGISSFVNRSLYDSCGGSELLCEVNDGFFYNLSSGVTYVLRMSERSLFAGPVNFNIQAFETAPNDECANADIIIPGVGTPTEISFDNRGATESMDASCETSGNINMDVWYEFEMPFDGDVEFTFVSSSTYLSIFDACGGSEISCFSGSNTAFGLTGGATYYLRASRWEIFADADPFFMEALASPLPTCTTTTEWIAGAWNNGTPDLSMNVIIRSNYDTATDGSFSCCSLSINSGNSLFVRGGDYVEVAYDVNVVGTLDINHEGSLVQRNDASMAVNNGTIRVRKTTPFLKPRDFMIMGSPMDSETREGVYNNAFIVLAHLTPNFVPNAAVAATFPMAENFADDNKDNWVHHTGLVNVGEGYLVRPQSSYGDGNTTYDLLYDLGTLNNGIVNVPLIFNTTQNDSPNILGNPYASAISANDFINANPEVDALYFWEHLTPPSPSIPGAYSMNFSMEDISMYNLMGGVAAASDPSGTNTIPNGYIASAQGFGVKATAAGTAVFNNSMRRLGNNNTLRTPSEERNRIWLQVENTEYELQSTTLIGFMEGASNGLDAGYDSKRLATVVSLFSLTEDGEELGIQSLGSFNTDRKVTLGFSTLVETETSYTISLTEWEGSAIETAEIYLYDALTQELVRLDQDDYTFTSGKATMTNRFTVLFRAPTLNVTDTTTASFQWFPNPSEGTVTVFNYNHMQLNKVLVYNTLGQLVSTKILSNGVTQQLDFSALQNGLYFLQWETGQGTFTDRLILK